MRDLISLCILGALVQSRLPRRLAPEWALRARRGHTTPHNPGYTRVTQGLHNPPSQKTKIRWARTTGQGAGTRAWAGGPNEMLISGVHLHSRKRSALLQLMSDILHTLPIECQGGAKSCRIQGASSLWSSLGPIATGNSQALRGFSKHIGSVFFHSCRTPAASIPLPPRVPTATLSAPLPAEPSSSSAHSPHWASARLPPPFCYLCAALVCIRMLRGLG